MSLDFSKDISVSGEDQVIQHLYGSTHIYEQILDLKFRISPEAFFQINTDAAEILYKSAIELACASESSTVVDICCGTGTIGLCFAKSCKQVLGLELIQQAVDDAKENAKINGIENSEFFAGKAEEILSSVCYKAKSDDVIGIVDPPRAGLHQKAITQLRKVRNLKKLVYISCNPNAALKNFVDLGRPMSKTMQEEPFVPIKAVAVDMFPYTKHCELVVYFERWDIVSKKE
ncbi:trna (uracil-5-)-methyltransferase [Holotrichia oblita]|uniref:Trna (Uracil-5-)-methyltransferase n=1 Tax=Holotrichia oblita TaxID=644536 RepID=A0ACB9SRP6_HOLOL|nr:trna (uracil-5-)-methyltransferase [Holotrichia oblita]